MDALYSDDSQVYHLHAEKYWSAHAGVDID